MSFSRWDEIMGNSRATTVHNIHGRRWGRGFRPYLIVLKLLCVAAYTGGLMGLLAVAFQPGIPGDREGWRQLAGTLHRAYAWVIVPGFVGAMAVGALLTASMARAMVRMRWFQVKVLLLVTVGPTLHVLLRGRLASFRHLVIEGDNVEAMTSAYNQLLAGTVAGLLFGIILLALGRVKPRLGQDYGKTFASETKPPGAS